MGPSERQVTSQRRRRLLEIGGDNNFPAQSRDRIELYQITWDQSGKPRQQQLSPLLTSSEKHISSPQLAGNVYTTPDRIPSNPSLPAQPLELSIEELNPFADSIWSYTSFLFGLLITWILYLVLPRGCRKKYCGAHRKRFSKRTDFDMPAAGYWLPASQSMSDAGSLPQRSAVHAGVAGGGPGRHPAPLLQTSSTISSLDGAGGIGPQPAPTRYPMTPQRDPAVATTTDSIHRRRNNPPSPEHPALKKIPPNRIIAETMGRLQGRGIRLVAHGVHCDPKRVWIKLEDDTQTVTWQTEFPRRVPNQSGQVSIVLMRGSLHRIALTNVLYIDVGKKTNALNRLDPTKVPEATCFSLLTQNGSLDLQANSKLERDSLVSCFSMILDDVHANEDWRALYEASPDPSLANSSVAGGGGFTGTKQVGTKSGSGGQKYPDPADLLVDV